MAAASGAPLAPLDDNTHHMTLAGEEVDSAEERFEAVQRVRQLWAANVCTVLRGRAGSVDSFAQGEADQEAYDATPAGEFILKCAKIGFMPKFAGSEDGVVYCSRCEKEYLSLGKFAEKHQGQCKGPKRKVRACRSSPTCCSLTAALHARCSAPCLPPRPPSPRCAAAARAGANAHTSAYC